MTATKSFPFLIIAFCLPVILTAQSSNTQKLIELGKAYKNFMFINEPTAGTLKEMKSDVPGELKDATAFIIQAITTDNKLLKNDFLTLPDERTLSAIFLIDAVSNNLHEDEPMDNTKLLDSLKIRPVSRYELVDNYYNMLFAAVGNKNKPFDLSRIDFRFKEFKLTDDVETGIFFLQCMRHCGSQIWGYMNVVKPPNTEKAYAEIKKFPRFNGQPYYQYNDFDFPDFTRTIVTKDGPESYKRYYIDKYYELLLHHLICLQKEGASEKEIQNMLLGSILKERKYYKYTNYKGELQQIFQEALQFNRNFVDGMNKWIAIEADSAGNHTYGFVYYDESGGPTLHRGGKFSINDDGVFVPIHSKLDSTSIKYRLEPSDQRVAIIPQSKYTELGIPEFPDWLEYYKTDSITAKGLFRRGYMYNEWGRPEQALTYLLQAQKREQGYTGLLLELAFSYNALEQYGKTIAVLKNAADRESNTCYYYKELTYAYIHLGQLDIAADSVKEALGRCNNKAMKAEIAYNMAGVYFRRKDQSNFKYWATQTGNWSEPDDQFSRGIRKMEADLNK